MNGTTAHLLLVDDDPLSLSVLDELLKSEFSTSVAGSGEAALELLQTGSTSAKPDLILLDVDMPGIDGYTTCKQLKQQPVTRDIPVIFLTSHDSVTDITHGFAMGAVDFIAKPLIPEVLLARVRTHVRLSNSMHLLENHNYHLEAVVEERTRDLQQRNTELLRVQELSIVALGALAETRDNETGNHIHRTQKYVRVLVEELAKYPHIQNQLGCNNVEIIWKSAPLHDIGKVGIPDNILLKPAKLSPDEFEIMKRHTALGRDALRLAEQRVQLDDSFLTVATHIAYSHHERWDGKGYPQGLSGQDIPFAARLMAVADVYDALITKRVYKPAYPHAVAAEMIREGRGTQFDPDIVDCFVGFEDAFSNIAEQFKDHS
jgi:putative two-component system response regulator